MKTKITLFALLLISLAQAQSLAWSKHISGTTRPTQFYMTGDASGNIFTTGWFSGTVDFDPGPATYTLNSTLASAFISKLDASGNFVWAANLHSLGTGTNGGASNGRDGMCTDLSGNVYLAGFFTGVCDFDPGVSTYALTSYSAGFQPFVWKLNANGGFEWAKQVPAGIVVKSCIIDGSGNLLLGGVFQGTCDFDWGSGISQFSSIGSWDGFIAKLDNAGNFIELKQFGYSGCNSSINSISLGASSEIQAVGTFYNNVDANPGSATQLLSAAGNSSFTVRLDASGNFLSAISLSSLSGSVIVTNVSLDIYGNTCVGGIFTGTIDLDPSSSVYTLQSNAAAVFVSKLNPAGSFIGAKSIETSTTYTSNRIHYFSDVAGNDYISAYFIGSVDCDPGAGVYSLSASSGGFTSILDGAGNFISGSAIFGPVVYADGSGNFYTNSYSSTDLIINKYSSILTGIEVNQKNRMDISVFPNPSTGEFRFINTALSDKMHFEVYNLTGQKLFERESDEQTTSLDLSSFEAGIYLLSVSNNEGKRSFQKLVKE